MIPYQTKAKKLHGTNFKEVKNQAEGIFKKIRIKTKRRPYVRSAYFKKQKVFFDFFWDHLYQKGPKERCIRLKYFEAAIDVLKNSKNKPITSENPHKKGEVLHRFAGLTRDKELFYVQIKENKKSGKKYLMSCFPAE